MTLMGNIGGWQRMLATIVWATVTETRIEQLQLSHDVAAPRAARRFVARVLEGWGIHADLVERSQLLVSELVSNAVLHGGGPIELLVSGPAGGPEVIRFEVRNGGEGQPVLRYPDRTELSGRGLRLIDDLSHRWGTQAHDGHTHVWFEVDSGGS